MTGPHLLLFLVVLAAVVAKARQAAAGGAAVVLQNVADEDGAVSKALRTARFPNWSTNAFFFCFQGLTYESLAVLTASGPDETLSMVLGGVALAASAAFLLSIPAARSDGRCARARRRRARRPRLGLTSLNGR